ncbi:hypothetical protein EVAR_20664_1 [Eumeta japonica]|uniref:MADF domain-containing protein n=1 Tax=Eumeta variegata TaxID=151549 RepID=A0A4C1V9Z3_EUMVA|nr:hypothetical protein EVAR_20664_1 [Eumeta japonica]
MQGKRVAGLGRSLWHITVRRTKLCRSELPANDVMRRFNAPQPSLLLPRVPIYHHCDDLMTNFTAARSNLHERHVQSNQELFGGGMASRPRGASADSRDRTRHYREANELASLHKKYVVNTAHGHLRGITSALPISWVAIGRNIINANEICVICKNLLKPRCGQFGCSTKTQRVSASFEFPGVHGRRRSAAVLVAHVLGYPLTSSLQKKWKSLRDNYKREASIANKDTDSSFDADNVLASSEVAEPRGQPRRSAEEQMQARRPQHDDVEVQMDQAPEGVERVQQKGLQEIHDVNSRLAIRKQIITAAHGYSQLQRSHQCADGLLGKNRIFDGGGNGLME